TDYPQLQELELLHANICRAIGDPRRIQILYALHSQSCHVTALSERLDIPQPTVSRHLSVLRQSGLVASERDGAAVNYRLTDPRVIEILDRMRAILRDSLERRSNIMQAD
ncbi:MAG: metalloregulator ArsR/SmtB family transcription factor, partial [Anaerolineae bacterium]|nr:metalloregulator ArsR/SmtB family transcription factor [Anaerolineae bacterium]